MLTPRDIQHLGMQRCPKCGKQTLSFDPQTNMLRCSNCGYQKSLQQ